IARWPLHGGPSKQSPRPAVRAGRGDQAADSDSAQVDPDRAEYLGENVCGNSLRSCLLAPRTGVPLRSLLTPDLMATSAVQALDPPRNARTSTSRDGGI